MSHDYRDIHVQNDGTLVNHMLFVGGCRRIRPASRWHSVPSTHVELSLRIC